MTHPFQLAYLPATHEDSVTTESCKELLAELGEDIAPGALEWKRVGKRGSGRVERQFARQFARKDGLAALVVSQDNGSLFVEAVAPSKEALAALVAVGEAGGPRAGAVIRGPMAPPELVRKFRGQLAAMGPRAEDYYDFVDAVIATPKGSPERLAFANLFVFRLPEENGDDEALFMISSGEGGPTPDHPHRLEDVFGDELESPNESCEHFVHLPPAQAIGHLLSLGMAYAPSDPDADVLPDYVAAMAPRLLAAKEEALMGAEIAPGKPSAGRPGM